MRRSVPVFLLALTMALPLHAQGALTFVERSMWVDPGLRDSVLAPRWDPKAGQSERLFCVTGYELYGDTTMRGDLRIVDRQYVVTAVKELLDVDRTTTSVDLFDRWGKSRCGASPWIHTHPPATCIRGGGPCVAGGAEAFECFPSTSDRLALQSSGAIFAGVWCGPNEHVGFFAVDFLNGMIVATPRAEGVPAVVGGASHVSPHAPAMAFTAALAVGLLANATLHLDSDAGGYVDSWTNEAAFSKKLVHGVVGYGLTSAAIQMGVPAKWAAPMTCAAAGVFETTQGHASWRDAVAGCAGGAIAALWSRVWK